MLLKKSLLLLSLLSSFSMAAMDFGLKGVDVAAEKSEFKIKERLVILKKNVMVSLDRGHLQADYIEVNTGTHDFKAVGNIIFNGQGNSMKADIAHGNLKTQVISIGPHQTNFGPWHTRGEEASRNKTKSVIIKNGKISTCGDPDEKQTYHIGAEKIVYQNDGKVYAHDAMLHLWGVPVLPLPYVTNRIEGSDGAYKIRPGFSSNYGPFLLISRRWKISENLTTTPMVDLMAKRGIAIGNETNHQTENSKTRFLAYGLKDNAPDSDGVDSFGRRINGRMLTEEERYRVHLKHHSTWKEHLTLRAHVDKMSDFEFNRDFFPEAYDRFEQRFTYIDAEWFDEYGSLSLNVRPRVNNFYTVTERLPELRYDSNRLELFEDTYYQTRNEASFLRMTFRDFDEALATGINSPRDYRTTRLDSSHFLYHDINAGDWLKIIPRAGFRVTHYGDSSQSAIDGDELAAIVESDDLYISPTNAITNYDRRGGNRTRLLYELGLEASFKAYKTSGDYQSEFWNINGLRHIMEPYINWNYIPKVTENRDNLYFFDENDRISRQHFVRLGFDNRWQTRHQGQIQSFIRFENYLDVHLDSVGRKEGFGHWGTHTELRPVASPFGVTADTLVNADRGTLDVFRLSGSYRHKLLFTRLGFNMTEDYTSRDVFSNGSILSGRAISSSFARSYRASKSISAGATYQWSKRFATSLGARYDLLRNQNIGWNSEVGYKFKCVTTALRYEDLTYRTGQDEYQVTLMLYLNAFPQTKMGSSDIGDHVFKDRDEKSYKAKDDQIFADYEDNYLF